MKWKWANLRTFFKTVPFKFLNKKFHFKIKKFKHTEQRIGSFHPRLYYKAALEL